jgi:Fe-S protein assembly co-chaperone HscB
MTSATDAFAALGAPPRLKQDGADLERRYFALSRELHPDRAADVDREAALARSAELNAAYGAVKDPLTRAKTWLALRGVRLETARSSTPSALAMRGFEVQEAAEALRAGDAEAADTLRILAADVARDRRAAEAALAAAAEEEPADASDPAHPFVRRVVRLVTELNYLGRQEAQAAAALEET